MQINLFDIRFKEILKWFGWILFFASIWLRGCSAESKPETITKVIVPEVKGNFQPEKPISKPIQEVKKDGLVYVENPLNKKLIAENEKLKSDFAKLKSDTLKQEAYNTAIELKTFHSNFEDQNIKLNINGIVRGEVEGITPSYTIKEREVDVPIKETYLRVFIGTGLGLNTDLNRGLYKFDLDFMNRKGDIFSGEYLRVNGQNFGVIGIKKSIINLKR